MYRQSGERIKGLKRTDYWGVGCTVILAIASIAYYNLWPSEHAKRVKYIQYVHIHLYCKVQCKLQ